MENPRISFSSESQPLIGKILRNELVLDVNYQDFEVKGKKRILLKNVNRIKMD